MPRSRERSSGGEMDARTLTRASLGRCAEPARRRARRGLEVCFSSRPGRRCGVLEGDIAYRARRLAEGGLARLFEDLAPVVALRGHELRVRQPTTATVELEGAGLVLSPSAFIAPRVATMLEPPVLVYPARGTAALLGRQPVEHWTRACRASSARLAPRSSRCSKSRRPPRARATAPADLPATSPITSRCSANAGLVARRRAGRRVLYRRTPLGQATLGQPSARRRRDRSSSPHRLQPVVGGLGSVPAGRCRERESRSTVGVWPARQGQAWFEADELRRLVPVFALVVALVAAVADPSSAARPRSSWPHPVVAFGSVGLRARASRSRQSPRRRRPGRRRAALGRARAAHVRGCPCSPSSSGAGRRSLDERRRARPADRGRARGGGAAPGPVRGRRRASGSWASPSRGSSAARSRGTAQLAAELEAHTAGACRAGAACRAASDRA